MRLIPLLFLALLFTTPAAAQENDLSAGVAAQDITPPVGYRMSGYFYERPSTGKHDPLHAKAIVLKQGDERAALVFCDLIGLSRDVTDQARQLASEKTKIPAENILVAATHSHTGPLYAGALRNHFHERAVKQHGSDPAEKVDYPQLLAQRIADAIIAADKKTEPAWLNAGRTEQQGLSFNRRFHMKDGTVRFNPGRQNPDIVRVAGPIDPDLDWLELWSQKKESAIGVLSVFALHLDTVGGTEYSADYPFHLGQKLQKTMGADCVSLFAAGTCGDINHIDVTVKDQPKGQEMAEHIGTSLANNILSHLTKAKRQQPMLAVRRSIVECPLQQYSAEEIAKAQANMDKIGTRELSFLEQVETCKIVGLQLLPKEKLPCEVQVFRLSSDVAIVGLPGEVFVDLGLAIKDQSPFEQTIVIELANDTPAYIPTKKAFAEGSYETVNSRLQSGSGEKLVEEAVRLLKELDIR